MNARNLSAAIALALIGTASIAAEGVQWTPETGAMTRAEVGAELARARAAGEIVAVSARYGEKLVAAKAVYAEPAVSREAVRAAARVPAQSGTLYIGG